MLEAAAQRLKRFGISNARLEIGDACQFPASVAHADVVLSNAVAQNLSPDEIGVHLRQCRRVLNPGGRIGICAIPWINLKTLFSTGALSDPVPKTSIRGAVGSLRRRIGLRLANLRGEVMADGIGYWHSREEIRSTAASEGFECDITTSWYYEYRFHARLRFRDGEAA
jgi:ubiquinone/menaquinone biosynthesis C-methylase UbiE